ncbi:hypothetical protein HPT25_19725 [Bacillus sp. BRMEA1]|uniref:hypothetical protein n=1 Tax=Neobacillus endophyticus TaxID=2738405 RepID=UPI001564C915|nr:hypothetical protein [Neobacillus endophyticus]
MNDNWQGDKPRNVNVSRGQLVEIGGLFRFPSIMEKNGAKCEESRDNQQNSFI